MTVSTHKNRWPLALLAAALLIAPGCDSNEDNSQALGTIPARSSADVSGEGMSCVDLWPVETVDEAIDAGLLPMVYGTIEKVEPVLDLFGALREKQTSCDSDVNPALRITLKVSDASWDWDESQTITLGVMASNWEDYTARPRVNLGESTITWSDGNKYFQPGSKLGTIGAFSTEGYFSTVVPYLFTIDADGKIEGIYKDPCLKGTLNGMQLQDILERTAKSGANRHEFREENNLLPLYSLCD